MMMTPLLTCLMALKSSEIAAVTQTRPSRSESQWIRVVIIARKKMRNRILS
jgi:hypothetical protein